MDQNKKPKVNILGGGISGITTALFFQLSGAETTLYTEQRPDQVATIERNPTLASLFPAASIIPHSVSSPLVDKLTADSQKIFNRLAEERLGSVWTQPHYEVFETPPTQSPSYASAMDYFQLLPSNGEGIEGAPRRRGAKAIFGWHFQTCFAQIPTYLPWLYKLYEAAGGEIKLGSISADSFLQLRGDVFINCTGLNSSMFGDDAQEAGIIRGHLIFSHVDAEKYPLQPVSYNYHPPKDIYQDANGHSADVYCYPRRSGGWALGGSRQNGEMRNGKWVGEQTVGRSVTISNIEVPEPIWTLNRELIQDLMHIDIGDFERTAQIGFRPVRTGATSLRVEQSPRYQHLFHNVGHGGSGVTLSWGCAIELVKLAQEKLGLTFGDVAPSRDVTYGHALNILRSMVLEP